MHLEQYQLVLLHRSSNAPDLDEQTAARVQAEHLAFYAALRSTGTVVTNGPVLEQGDERLRGLAVFALSSLAQARKLAGTDPAVTAGRLEVDAMTWWCPPGTMTRPGTPIHLDD